MRADRRWRPGRSRGNLYRLGRWCRPRRDTIEVDAHRPRQMRPLLALSARSRGGRRPVRSLRRRWSMAELSDIGRRPAASDPLRATGFAAWRSPHRSAARSEREMAGHAVRSHLPDRGEIELLPIFELHWVNNNGVSLGLLSADSAVQRWLLVGLTAAISVAVSPGCGARSSATTSSRSAWSLGGALGNILDRVRFGYVVDFLDLHFGDWHPVFGLQSRRCGDYHRRLAVAGPGAVDARTEGPSGESLKCVS